MDALPSPNATSPQILAIYDRALRVFQELAELFRQNSIEAEVGQQPAETEIWQAKFNAVANLTNLFQQVRDLLSSGHSEEEARLATNFDERIQLFLSLQANWFTLLSPQAVFELTGFDISHLTNTIKEVA